MEIWLDTANTALIEQYANLGIIDGVTTNPTIASQSDLDLENLIFQILERQEGLLAVQVLADNAEEMIAQAEKLANLSSKIIVKIPVTVQGLQAIYALSKKGILTLGTAIFESRQALLAFKAGATYLAPYLGKIKDNGQNCLQVLEEMLLIKENYQFPSKIMAAGIKEIELINSCAHMGIDAITLPDQIFLDFIEDHTLTVNAIDKFRVDWQKAKETTLFATP